ncbi:MAG: hypothetical protein HKN23_10490 [Verrucomicrobiales bacterium]|nr:hypothetical protein [Verrucomicrobiales bacterium]
MILKKAFEKLFKIREEAGRARRRSKYGADEGFDPQEKPFLDHLEDLRKTLMQMVITLLIITIFTFVFNKQIFEFVQMPAKVAKVDDVGTTLWDVSEFLTLSPQELLMLAIKTSFIAGVILAFPILVYQSFQFILPGLRQVEKKMVIPGAIVGFFLFLTGASFAFFMAAPIALKFFYEFEQERTGAIDPTKAALERPIAEFALVGVKGEKIPPTEGQSTAAPEGDGEAKEEPSGFMKFLMGFFQSDEEEATDGETPESPAPKQENPDPAQSDNPTPENANAPPAVDPNDPDIQKFRNYLIQSLAFKEGSEIALRYDDTRDKIVVLKVKGRISQYRVGDYINFITRLTMVFGLSFQLPVVVTILVKLELLTARVMRATRAYAWVIMMVAAAIFTPPDIITLGLLAGPLILLYEICIWIAMVMERTRARKQAAEEEERRARLEKLYSTPADDLSEEEKEELHRHEIEQYEKEHADLYDGEHGHDHDHDHDHDYHGDDPHHDDPYHNDPYHDEHGNPIEYDPHHDESWDHDHHHGEDADEHDPHHGEEGHTPVQDWPDRNEDGSDPGESSESADERGELESDHAEPTEADADDAEEDENSESAETVEEEDHDVFDDDEVCEPTGPIVDLNHADKDELLTLPGMDDELAEMIIEHRPYETFDNVEDVPGMTPDLLNEMIERLMLG